MRASSGKHNGILVGADRTTGKIRTIDEVPSGKACDCLCPYCRTSLIAKKGEVVTHHFAHEHLPESIRTCQETALHEVAKIATAHLIDRIKLPERIEKYQSTERLISNSGMMRTQGDTLTMKETKLERLSGSVEPIVPDISPFRPDARLQTLQGDIFVEIHVTNPVAPDKQKAMQEADLAVLEIDLSQVPRAGLSLAAIIQLVTSDAPRHWRSNGLRKWVEKARHKLDEEIRQSEREKHATLFRALRDTKINQISTQITINTVRHKLSDRGVSMVGKISLDNLRSEKGFWLADIPSAPGALITAITNEAMINRLFAWHKATRNHALTVLSISDTNTLYSNDFDVVQEIAAKLRTSDVGMPQTITRVRVVDRYNANQVLESPITPAKLQALGSRAYVGRDIPENLIRDLIINELAELVVSYSGNRAEAYALSATARRFNGIRPSGGMREQVLHRVQYHDPCLVRFVPAVSPSLNGDVFDRLTVYRDELYFDLGQGKRVRVYFNRADYWKKGGLLMLPDPMRRGAYHLEASNSFLRMLDPA